MFIPISGDPCHLDQHFIRRSGVFRGFSRELLSHGVCHAFLSRSLGQNMAGGIAAIWVALFVFLAGFHTTSSRSFVVDWKNDVFLKVYMTEIFLFA